MLKVCIVGLKKDEGENELCLLKFATTVCITTKNNVYKTLKHFFFRLVFTQDNIKFEMLVAHLNMENIYYLSNGLN